MPHAFMLTVVETENEADKTKVQMPNFAPSKWETVDESELEAQGGWVSSCFYLICYWLQMYNSPSHHLLSTNVI